MWKEALEGLLWSISHKLSVRPEDCRGKVRMRHFKLTPRCRWYLRISANFYRRFGTIDRSHQGSDCSVGPLKMGPIGFPATSFTQYQFTLRKVPEERRFQKSECLQSQPAFKLASTSDSTAWASLCGAASYITAASWLCGTSTDVTVEASLCGAACDITVWDSLCGATSDIAAASWLCGASNDVTVEAILCGAASDFTAWGSLCGAAAFTFLSLRDVH
jgi:hypothetical protein